MFENRNILDNIADIAAKMIDTKAKAVFCHISENATYIAYIDNEPKYTIRISRQGYRSYLQLKSEIEWLRLIDDLNVPEPVNIKGNYVNVINNHYVTVFKYIKGIMPQYNDSEVMYNCGKIAAMLHKSPKPDSCYRPVWSVENMIGKKGIWGDWRENKDLSQEDIDYIENILGKISLNIKNYKTDKYGLIHFDLRMTNIVINDEYYAIDFDDCGYGYYIQDLASALSFMEDSPAIEELKSSWYKGYEEIMPLDNEDKAMADSFIILRRIQLLAWVTSHYNSDYVKRIEKGFAKESLKIIESLNKKI